MHGGLSDRRAGADASSVRIVPTLAHARRARSLVAIAAIACAVAAGSAHAADGGEGVGDEPLTSLGGAATVDGSSETDGAPSGGGPVVPEGAIDTGTATAPGTDSTDTEPALDDDATDAELRAERTRIAGERGQRQSELLRHEAARQQAERRADAALQAIAQRLIDLLDQQEDARLQSLMAVRDVQDPETRAQLLATLRPADRALVDAHEAALDEATRIGVLADAAREDVLRLGTRAAAIDALLEARKGPTAAELARTRGDTYTFDADYVFATGPIPGIGYWGAASGGGSALSGWMGYASAAVGGIGCDPTDPAMKPTGQVESGEASWYGPGFQGSPTANGETFDTQQLTAAHRTLPFGTIVRVYSSATARCVFVRINDRGPFVDGRVIDLSRAAADAIGMESVAPVQLEVYAAPGAATPAA